MTNIVWYQERIRDHYYNPRNKGYIENAHCIAQAVNSSCGDSVTYYFNVDNSNMGIIRFQGAGCVISQAAASLLSERVVGQSLCDIKQITASEIITMLGISLGPVRARCALLAWEALMKGINSYVGSSEGS
jgi:nitrogen fixation NifU-like protein